MHNNINSSDILMATVNTYTQIGNLRNSRMNTLRMIFRDKIYNTFKDRKKYENQEEVFIEKLCNAYVEFLDLQQELLSLHSFRDDDMFLSDYAHSEMMFIVIKDINKKLKETLSVHSINTIENTISQYESSKKSKMSYLSNCYDYSFHLQNLFNDSDLRHWYASENTLKLFCHCLNATKLELLATNGIRVDIDPEKALTRIESIKRHMLFYMKRVDALSQSQYKSVYMDLLYDLDDVTIFLREAVSKSTIVSAKNIYADDSENSFRTLKVESGIHSVFKTYCENNFYKMQDVVKDLLLDFMHNSKPILFDRIIQEKIKPLCNEITSGNKGKLKPAVTTKGLGTQYDFLKSWTEVVQAYGESLCNPHNLTKSPDLMLNVSYEKDLDEKQADDNFDQDENFDQVDYILNTVKFEEPHMLVLNDPYHVKAVLQSISRGLGEEEFQEMLQCDIKMFDTDFKNCSIVFYNKRLPHDYYLTKVPNFEYNYGTDRTVVDYSWVFDTRYAGMITKFERKQIKKYDKNVWDKVAMELAVGYYSNLDKSIIDEIESAKIEYDLYENIIVTLSDGNKEYIDLTQALLINLIKDKLSK